MKIWIKTSMKNIGTVDEPDHIPNFGGLESKVPYSLMKINFPNEVLLRVAGMPAQNATILADAAITEQTDEQAKTIIQSKHPDSSLENFDIADPEIDEIAKSLGLDTHLRADIQIPSRGKQLLQDQENYLMAQISTKKGISRPMWDNEAVKSGKYLKGIDIENDVIDGKGAAHEFILSRLR